MYLYFGILSKLCLLFQLVASNIGLPINRFYWLLSLNASNFIFLIWCESKVFFVLKYLFARCWEIIEECSPTWWNIWWTFEIWRLEFDSWLWKSFNCAVNHAIIPHCQIPMVDAGRELGRDVDERTCVGGLAPGDCLFCDCGVVLDCISG